MDQWMKEGKVEKVGVPSIQAFLLVWHHFKDFYQKLGWDTGKGWNIYCRWLTWCSPVLSLSHCHKWHLDKHVYLRDKRRQKFLLFPSPSKDIFELLLGELSYLARFCLPILPWKDKPKVTEEPDKATEAQVLLKFLPQQARSEWHIWTWTLSGYFLLPPLLRFLTTSYAPQ